MYIYSINKIKNYFKVLNFRKVNRYRILNRLIIRYSLNLFIRFLYLLFIYLLSNNYKYYYLILKAFNTNNELNYFKINNNYEIIYLI